MEKDFMVLEICQCFELHWHQQVAVARSKPQLPQKSWSKDSNEWEVLFCSSSLCSKWVATHICFIYFKLIWSWAPISRASIKSIYKSNIHGLHPWVRPPILPCIRLSEYPNRKPTPNRWNIVLWSHIISQTQISSTILSIASNFPSYRSGYLQDCLRAYHHSCLIVEWKRVRDVEV